MTTPQQLRQQAAAIWRTRAFRSLRRRGVRALRRSPRARRLAQQIFAARPTAAGYPIDVTAGNLLGGVGTEQLPVVLVVALEVSPDQLSDIVDDIAAHQVQSAAFRPVFVIDTVTFGPTRRYGYPVELVTARRDWAGPDRSWEEYLRQRLSSTRRHFRVSVAIQLGPAGLDPVSRALLA